MFLQNLWYFALPGNRLKPGKFLGLTLLGEPLLVGRAQDGKPFALRDLCPHRGIPLTAGRFDGAEVECCYHGWRFNTEGRCTAIPSLVEGGKLDAARIKVKRYPCREVQGNLWIYFGEENGVLPEVPTMPEIGEHAPQLFQDMLFPCHIDHAVVGLMDPAHGPFVHRAWWWRSRRSIHEKARRFVPAALGWRMARHKPSSNSFGYRLLGGEMSTEIEFRLPGVRIEHIRAGRHVLCGLTAVTPISAAETRVNHAIYWTMPWLSLLKPFLAPFARAFLEQDRHIVELQQTGLKHEPPLMLIDDADTQAKWYYRLKKEFAAAVAEHRPFQNPVTERTLRWRS
jgi:phenylpropionate dioxygenase-like ring-hydroxylating dioxygenase large terminal subunit